MTKLYIVLSVLVVLCGCQSTPQQVNFSPTPPVVSSDVGKDTTIAVRVIDDRLSKSLGSSGGTEITGSKDMTAVVKQQIIDGLRKKGFNPVSVYSSEGKGPLLTVEIYELGYSTPPSNPSYPAYYNAYIKGALKVVALRAATSFERMYRTVEGEKRGWSFTNAKTPEQWINEVLSDVLRQLLEDEELLKFLGGFCPTLRVVSSDAGENFPVSVRVIDERTSKFFGPSELDIGLQQQVIDDLRKKGFNPVPMYYGEGKDPRLTAEIRLLEYSLKDHHIKAAVKAIAVRGGKYFERMYRTEKVVPFADRILSGSKANERRINEALSDFLRQLLEDPELLRFLAG